VAPDQPEPRIEITTDGPYRIVGAPPVVRTSPIETEYGEPVAWAPDQPLDVPSGARLCRCGRSSTKPFCDDTHLQSGFDGTEVADRGAYDDRAHTYRGRGLTLYDDLSLCTHAGFCGDRFQTVWQMLPRASDPEVGERIRHMTRLCPSGRIVTEVKGAETRDEPGFEPSIAVEENGPVWVRGKIPVVAADGTPYEVRNRQTLCRCGGSGNKPFCDGSHRTNGFRDG
jgi:CDGSH-type Zn-finger protein